MSLVSPPTLQRSSTNSLFFSFLHTEQPSVNVFVLFVFQDEKDCTPLPEDQSLQSEEDIAIVTELHRSLLPVEHGYVNHKIMQFGFPQTQSSPSSLSQSVFCNPSYDSTMQTEDQQSDSGPKLQERAPLDRCSSGYQPQSNAETLTLNLTADPDSPLSCDSTYILLPRSPSEQ